MGTGPAGELSARSHGWDQFPSILICYLSFSSKSQTDIDGDALVDFRIGFAGGRVTLFRPDLKTSSRSNKDNVPREICGNRVGVRHEHAPLLVGADFVGRAEKLAYGLALFLCRGP